MSSTRPYKVVLLGEGRVGKTSILLRFMRNDFSDKQTSTLSASFFDKTVPIGAGESARMSVWDTAGQERFHALGPLYYRDAGAASDARARAKSRRRASVRSRGTRPSLRPPPFSAPTPQTAHCSSTTSRTSSRSSACRSG
jgi:hypothetical protein